MTWHTFFTDPLMTLFLVGLVIIGAVLVWWHIKDGEFDLRDLLLDTKTRRVSIEKVGMVTALITSTWGFVSQIQDGKMTEWYFAGYITLWGGFRGVSKWLDNRNAQESEAKP